MPSCFVFRWFLLTLKEVNIPTICLDWMSKIGKFLSLQCELCSFLQWPQTVLNTCTCFTKLSLCFAAEAEIIFFYLGKYLTYSPLLIDPIPFTINWQRCDLWLNSLVRIIPITDWSNLWQDPSLCFLPRGHLRYDFDLSKSMQPYCNAQDTHGFITAVRVNSDLLNAIHVASSSG